MKTAILGGTGTLGQALTTRLLADGHEVHIFSRCELKQAEMAKRFPAEAEFKIRFTVGDIRDAQGLRTFMDRVKPDVVYYAAALKHVDVLERNPEQAVYTNILGTINVADACEAARVPVCVFSSTDKAVDPINVYGMSKGIAEGILFNRNRLNKEGTRYSVFRWGNIVGSRGSAIPKFIESLKKNEVVTVTDPEMTRYWIRIEDAVDFVIRKQFSANLFDAEVPPMKSATVYEVIEALAEMLDVRSYRLREIGNRGGEKMHEMIRSLHSVVPQGSETAERYTKEELKELFKFAAGAK